METAGRLLVVLLLTSASSGLRWSERLMRGSGPFQVCSGQNIQLFFNFTLDPGERLKGMVWGCQPEGEEEGLLATYMDDHFVPVSSFSGRLSHLQDGGIELSCATILESGNYSIAVTTEDSNSRPSVYRKTVSVIVLDTPKTWTGDLHTIRNEEAVRDVTTGSWHVQLSCGNFSDRGRPSVGVIWTTPAGSHLASTGYHEGFFNLLLPNPVVGGNYSCRIDPSQAAARCLDGDSHLLDTVSVEVQETAARFSLLEARQQELKEQLEVDRKMWKEALNDAGNRTDALEQRLDNATLNSPPPIPPPISFHVTLTSPVLLLEGSVLKLNNVVNNQGEGYDSSTGYFTAPVNGTYFFIGTLGIARESFRMGVTAGLRLKKGDGSTVAESFLRVQDDDGIQIMGSCHGIVLLRAGTTVWLEGVSRGSHFHPMETVTFFTGFRV